VRVFLCLLIAELVTIGLHPTCCWWHNLAHKTISVCQRHLCTTTYGLVAFVSGPVPVRARGQEPDFFTHPDQFRMGVFTLLVTAYLFLAARPKQPGSPPGRAGRRGDYGKLLRKHGHRDSLGYFPPPATTKRRHRGRPPASPASDTAMV
jgi:hypothetical protein